MVRRALRERVAQEGAQRQRILDAPSDAAFRVEPFEIADEQHLEIDDGRDAGAAVLRVEPRAKRLGEGGEAMGVHHDVQALIESVPRRTRDAVGRHKQGILNFPRILAHRHGGNPPRMRQLYIDELSLSRKLNRFATGC